MEMLNRAIGDADAFTKMMSKATGQRDAERSAVIHASQEVLEWNAEVERKRAEKKARKAQHTKALNGLR